MNANPADPRCLWCKGTGSMPQLVEHPEDHTAHIEYVDCLCTRPSRFPWSAVVCCLLLAAAITLALAMCISILVVP